MSLAGATDSLISFSVLAFAAWTLIYDLGLAANLRTTVLLGIWAVSIAAIITMMVRSRAAAGSRPAMGPAPETAAAAGPRPAWQRALTAAGVACGIGAGVAVGSYSLGMRWVWVPVLGLASAAATGILLLTGREQRAAGRVPDEVSPAGSVLAASVAAAAAIFSLYMVRPTPDDVYYLSRSVWTAQHGQIPVRDILFSNQVLRPVATEVPISSIEVLDGALARVLGIQASTFTYEISLPVLTFIAVWAVWLLIRRWARGRYALCFAVAMVYVAWTGGGASFGAFHLGTMWEGKAAFVSAMVPLLYVYLTDWAENPTRRGLVLVAASGIAAAGLSSVAVYVVPLIAAAVMAPLLLKRKFKEAAGAALSPAYPLIAGLVVALGPPLTLIPHFPFTAPIVWTWVMRAGVVGAIGGVALWIAPWLARREVPALITAGVAGVAAILMMPGVIELLNDKVALGGVLYRVLWMAPVPVLAGMLATVPLPLTQRSGFAGRVLIFIPSGAVSAALVVSGIAVWSHDNGVTLVSHPSWKVRAYWLSRAVEVVHADHSQGDILATSPLMETVPLLTTRIRVVNPRAHYLTQMAASSQFIADRQLLTALANGRGTLPGEAAVRAALTRADVGYACFWNSQAGAIRLVEQAGFAPAARFGALRCLRR